MSASLVGSEMCIRDRRIPMCLLQEADAALLKVPHQHRPLASSLLRDLVDQPAEVPTGNLGGLQ
eukprot:5611050-Alexandrium_andersonii.AAC.1